MVKLNACESNLVQGGSVKRVVGHHRGCARIQKHESCRMLMTGKLSSSKMGQLTISLHLLGTGWCIFCLTKQKSHKLELGMSWNL